MGEQNKVLLHKGIYKTAATTTDAVFMITGMTIGVGILAIPYAVAQVGLLVGLGYIVALGLIIYFLNLMVGEIAIRTNEEMQLGGFAGKYLGNWARYLLSTTFILSALGTLLIQIIVEGISLSSIFGGKPEVWSVIFWSIGSFCVLGGLRRVKIIDKIFGLAIIAIIAGISFYILPRFQASTLLYFNAKQIFYPLGIILFGLHASPAICEAHSLLQNRQKEFRRALTIATAIPVALYVLFTAAVVGFTGNHTTEIATTGLKVALGPTVGFLLSLYTIMALSTGFIGVGTALRETLVWDHKIPDKAAVFFVVSIPFAFFLLGVRGFAMILDVLGTVCIGTEALVMAAIYLTARKGQDNIPEKYLTPRHPWLVSFPVIAFFSFLLVFSFYRFFIK